VSSLLRKSLRDLKSYRGQALCIALLVAVVSVLVTGGVRARSMLQASRDIWYERLAFADLELHFQPTHKGLAEMALAVEGVRDAEERLLAEGLIESEGLRPLPALLQVLPAGAQPSRQSCRRSAAELAERANVQPLEPLFRGRADAPELADR
jgi:hypothetical protein